MKKNKAFSAKRNTGTLFTVPVVIAMVVLCVIIFCAVFAPLISPYDPVYQDIGAALSGPTDQHILGTDSVGRDLLSRLFYGGRTTIVGGLAIISLSILLGLPIGLFCGYYGGLIDSIFMRVCDILLSFPSMLLAFVLVAGFGRGSMNNAIIALGVIYVPGLARLVRSLTLVEKTRSMWRPCAPCAIPICGSCLSTSSQTAFPASSSSLRWTWATPCWTLRA